MKTKEIFEQSVWTTGPPYQIKSTLIYCVKNVNHWMWTLGRRWPPWKSNQLWVTKGPTQDFVIFDKIPSRYTETFLHFIKKYFREIGRNINQWLPRLHYGRRSPGYTQLITHVVYSYRVVFSIVEHQLLERPINLAKFALCLDVRPLHGFPGRQKWEWVHVNTNMIVINIILNPWFWKHRIKRLKLCCWGYHHWCCSGQENKMPFEKKHLQS